MKKLWMLAARILLINSAIVISVAWCFSHWYFADIYLGAPGHQAFIHCDEGGWYADIRRYPDMTVAWGVALNSATVDPAQRRFPNNSSASDSLIDAFDEARMWKLSGPGVRYLSNSGLGVRGRGLQTGFAARHWLLFSLSMLAICVWSYRLSRRKIIIADDDNE